jgi:hypothetical protein
MKHIRKFESHRNLKKVESKELPIKESVLQINDIYKVKAMVDVPKSLLNAYSKKVKEAGKKELDGFFSMDAIAEELVKYVLTNFLDVDKIPAGALYGETLDELQGQAQVQIQPQAQPQVQPQAQEAPTKDDSAIQPQGQPQGGTEPQVQPEPQAQPQGSQVQVQVQSGDEDGFEDTDGKEESQEDEEDNLPI